jgi:hypothetical protein
VKIGCKSAASIGCCSRRAWPSASRRKWTLQGCQGQPSTRAIAFFKPACASEMTSCTPLRPRSTNERRSERQNPPSPPRRRPVRSPRGSRTRARRRRAPAPCARRDRRRGPARPSRPATGTGSGPSSGRWRNASTCSSKPWQIRETSLFEIRSRSDSTTWSTLRVETPATYAFCTTETSACSERRRGSRKLGKSCRDATLAAGAVAVGAVGVATETPLSAGPAVERVLSSRERMVGLFGLSPAFYVRRGLPADAWSRWNAEQGSAWRTRHGIATARDELEPRPSPGKSQKSRQNHVTR